MSKIALSPDGGGTGTFTLASPNSNTNRTLTLPDAAGELLTSTGVGSGLTSLTSANLTGALPALDGSALTGVPNSSKDVAILFLYASETQSKRLNMVDGIVDAFKTSTDVAPNGDLDFAYGSITTRAAANSPSNMTSLTAPAPLVASASAGTDAWQAFDGSNGSYAGGTSTLPWSVQVDMGTSVTTEEYTIACRLTSYNYYWKAWTFYGSNDGSTWVTIDSKSGKTAAFWSPQEQQFPISSRTYRYWKWTVTQLGAGGLQAIVGTLGVSRLAASLPQNLESVAFSTATAPSTARLGVQSVGSLTINTDLIGYVSRDGGTTWTTANLVLVETLADGTNYYEDSSIDISGQPSGTDMKYKITFAGAALTSVNGALLQWS